MCYINSVCNENTDKKQDLCRCVACHKLVKVFCVIKQHESEENNEYEKETSCFDDFRWIWS